MKIKLLIVSLLVLIIAVSCGTKKAKITPVANASIVLTVEGMSCTGCEETIQTALAKIDGVIDVKASHTDSVVKVSYDSTLVKVDQLGDEINKLDYQYKGIRK